MRKKIGIITGSGPEAGIDLWQKILYENKLYLNKEFKGDLDAPNVTIFSIPQLGYSMELEKNYDMVWESLKQGVIEICKYVDYFVIACNTLNLYASKIESIGYKHKFLSTLDVLEDYIKENNLNKIAIIAAMPILQMKEYSVFKPLYENFNVELPSDFSKVHNLIYEVKRSGGKNKEVIKEFDKIVKSLTAKEIFLACTELPLIDYKNNNKNLIDVTELLAKKLIQKSFK